MKARTHLPSAAVTLLVAVAILGTGSRASAAPRLIDVAGTADTISVTAGTRLRFVCSGPDDTPVRLVETRADLVWFDGPASDMDLGWWAIRALPVKLEVRVGPSPARRLVLDVTADTEVLYPGLDMRLKRVPDSGRLPVDPDAFAAGAHSAGAIPASRPEYAAYPAFRVAESVLPRLEERPVHNFRAPDTWHMVLSQPSMSDDPGQIVAWRSAVTHPVPDLNRPGVVAQIRGRLMVDEGGRHRFGIQASIPVHVRIGPMTMTNRVIYKRTEKGDIQPQLFAVTDIVDLQPGLVDVQLTLDAREPVSVRLHLAWQPPGANALETIDGGRFLHAVSPATEAAYQAFTQGAPWRDETVLRKEAPADDDETIPEGRQLEAAASDRISYLQVSRKLLKAWQNGAGSAGGVAVGRALLALTRRRVAVLRQDPSQRLPGTFANKIDGDTLVLFEDLRGFLESCLRHPELQREALETRCDMHAYTALIHSRSFFAEDHSGTNDGYGDHNNFLVNNWRGARAWDDPIAFDMARCLYDNHFCYRPGRREGLHSDHVWSFHNANGRHVNMGGYGRDWIRRTLNDLHIGTPWGNTPEQYRRMAEFILAWEWFFYRGAKAFTVAGRHNTHVGDMNPEYAQRLLALPAGALSQSMTDRVKAQADRLADGRPLTGNRFFFRHLQMIHRGPGYYLDVKMNSPQVGGVETFAGAQPGNLSFGDGVTTILRHGDEYRAIHAYNIPESLWRFRSLPGTTQLDLEWGNLAKWQGLDRYRGGGGATAGGVSDGDNGHCAFEFVSHKRNATRARKFFAFGDAYMMVLGSDIIGRTPAPKPYYSYRTNLNQCHFRQPVTVVAADGRRVSITADQTGQTLEFALDQRYWIEHDGVGYIVLPAEESRKLMVRTSMRTPVNRLGPEIWEDPKMSDYRRKCDALLKADPPRQVPVLEIWVDHGAQPNGAACAYIVCMQPERRDPAEWLAEPPVVVLSNTPVLQAVRDAASGVIHAFFHRSGALRGPEGKVILASRNPAAVMLTPQSLRIQDPTAACVKKTEDMADTIRLTIRRDDGSIRELAVRMPGAGDPDDRYRGAVARVDL